MNEEDRAKDIDAAIKAHDAKRRDDAEEAANMGMKLDKLLECLDFLSSRIDSFEASEKERMDAKRKDGIDEGREASDPKEVVADSRADSQKRNALLAEAQSRADKVASAFGRSAPRPLDGESVRAYRTRLLADYRHNSSDYRDVPLNLISELPEEVFKSRSVHLYRFPDCQR